MPSSVSLQSMKQILNLCFRYTGVEEKDDGTNFSEHVVPINSKIEDQGKSSIVNILDRSRNRNSVISSTASMNEQQWAKLKILVEKAAKLNFMTEKQNEIVEKCIERREQTVLSVLKTSGGNFNKVCYYSF